VDRYRLGEHDVCHVGQGHRQQLPHRFSRRPPTPAARSITTARRSIATSCARCTIAALFFVGTPLVLAFVVRDWRVLLTLGAGAAFVWPFWKVIEANRPRSYDARFPPGELMD
jgi:hypothetical protein